MIASAMVNDAETRARLSESAFRGYARLMDFWDVSTDERIDLLGASVTRGTLANWAGGKRRFVLSGDQLMRISFLLGIYEGLERIWRHAPVQSKSWIRRPRPDGPFRGATPLDFMRAGGIPALVSARAYVDGITGGPPSRGDYVQPPREAL